MHFSTYTIVLALCFTATSALRPRATQATQATRKAPQSTATDFIPATETIDVGSGSTIVAPPKGVNIDAVNTIIVAPSQGVNGECVDIATSHPLFVPVAAGSFSNAQEAFKGINDVASDSTQPRILTYYSAPQAVKALTGSEDGGVILTYYSAPQDSAVDPKDQNFALLTYYSAPQNKVAGGVNATQRGSTQRGLVGVINVQPLKKTDTSFKPVDQAQLFTATSLTSSNNFFAVSKVAVAQHGSKVQRGQNPPVGGTGEIFIAQITNATQREAGTDSTHQPVQVMLGKLSVESLEGAFKGVDKREALAGADALDFSPAAFHEERTGTGEEICDECA